MNKNIFNNIIPDRRNTCSLKFDGMESIFGDGDLEPFWIADMDFCTPKFVIEAVDKRLNHHVFGYPVVDKVFFELVSFWFYKRFNISIAIDHIVPMTGIVASIFTAILAFSDQGDGVVVQPPVYGPFFELVNSSGRKLIENPLVVGANGYEIDFYSLEKIFSKAAPKILLFCSPHNPVGRVWYIDELTRLALMCSHYGVTIISDEVHFDLIYPPHKHTTLLSIKEIYDRLIVLSAPTKTFNIPGLNVSYAVIPNSSNKNKFEILAKKLHQTSPNIFGLEALKACYEFGDKWLEGVILYLMQNRTLIDTFIRDNCFVQGFSPEGTYLYWLDFSSTGLSQKNILEKVNNAGLALSIGDSFFNSRESMFLRFNFATDKSRVEFALNRLKECFKTHPNF